MKIKLIAVGCLMACMVCPAAFAQDNYSKSELFVGFSLMGTDDYDYDSIKSGITDSDYNDYYDWHDLKLSNKASLNKGFSVSHTSNYNSWIGLDKSFRYNTGRLFNMSETAERHWDDSWSSEKTNREVMKSRVTFLAGPRFTFRDISSRVTPFVYGLVGVSYETATETYETRRTDSYDYNYESSGEELYRHIAFRSALGGGLDISINKSLAIRAIQADWFFKSSTIWGDDPYINEDKRFSNVNLSFGIVYRYGK